MFIVSHAEYRYLGGPSDGRLLPRDQILSVNGVDVRHENKLGVVEMIRKSTTVLRLEVAQPPRKVKIILLIKYKNFSWRTAFRQLRREESASPNGF
jgi:C-terminal processing protease CtpA/Prc